MRRSIDTETTGIDFRHGTMPFFVTTCDEDGNQQWWEWDVDPLTRKPLIPESDVDELAELLSPNETSELVLQNPKFDVTALATVRPEFGEYWRWDITHDTLMAGHLLASNQPHDLTTMALQYLGVDIEPYEVAIVDASNKARAIARRSYPDWRIAKKGLPEMPSAKEKVAKFDMWLPQAIAREENYADDHPWWTVLSDYANADSSVTLPLFLRMKEILEQRGLWEIYLERIKLIPIIYRMEDQGITINRARLEELRTEYQEESARAGRICTNIAAGYDYELTLPKSGNNGSLTKFVFDVMKLPVLSTSKKTGKPGMDKTGIEAYQATLPERSKELTFIRNLSGKRKRDTALSYMEGYERYWVPLGIYNEAGEQLWYRLFPSLNATGTDTLRFSSSNPNEQNISKQDGFNLRYMFGPAPGREWWALDYINLELVLPAYRSGQQSMIDLFEKPDDPPFFGSYHLLNASIIYPDLFWPLAERAGEFKKKYSSTWYQWCKNAGFALIYGCQEEKFDQTCKKKGAYALLRSKLPNLFEFAAECVAHAERYGYVETLPDRTVNSHRGYPLYCGRNNFGRVSPTIPLNYTIQGTAMWVMGKAMIRCDDYLLSLAESTTQEYNIAIQVHDELVFDFPKGGVSNLSKIKKIKQLMEKSGDDLGIPLRVSVSYHPDNWAQETAIKTG